MKHTVRSLVCSILAAGCALAVPSSVSAFSLFGGGKGPAPFVFAKGGAAKAAVVVAPNAPAGVRFAAGELTNYLHQITGGDFVLAEKPVGGLNTILVGAPYKAAHLDEIAVRVKDAKTLEVTGDGPRGTLYAVYDLLETLGCGFWAHDYETVPAARDLSLAGDYAKVDWPFMTWRGMWSHLGRTAPVYCLKQRLNAGDTIGKAAVFGIPGQTGDFGQTLPGYFLTGKDFKAHPEWFAWNRARGTNILNGVCASSEGMYQQLFQEVGDWLAKNYPKGAREVPLGANDGLSFCECSNCLALARSDTNPENAEVPAIQHIVILNRVGKHFAKQYPDVRFNMLAYDMRGPADSAKFKFEPNVGAGLAVSWRNYGPALETIDLAGISVERWAKLSDKNGMYHWDYYGNFNDFLSPFPNLDTMGPNFRYYKRLGMKGINPQMQYASGGDLAELHYYLLGKLAWNPDADDKLLVSNYLAGAYGKAAPFIQQYIDLLERAKKRQYGVWTGFYSTELSHILTPADCLGILRLFDQARAAVKDDPGHAKMVRRASLAEKTMELYRYSDLVEPARIWTSSFMFKAPRARAEREERRAGGSG